MDRLSLDTQNNRESIYSNISNKYPKPYYKGVKVVDKTPSAADEFIQAGIKETEKSQKSNLFTKIITTPSVMYPTLASLFAYMGYGCCLKATGNPEKLAKFKKNIKLRSIAILGLGIATALGVNKLYQKNEDKHYNDIKEYFNSINKTNAKLAPDMFSSGYKLAFYSPVSGEIKLNKTQLNDPLNRLKNKGIIRHELVHAKQYETIARSKDGIKKINYACAKNIVTIAKNNPVVKLGFQEVYQDINNDKTGKYDNVQVTLPTGKVHLKNYINAINTLINNDKAAYNDIPIFINSKHYEDVIQKEGPLSKEDEEKANQYYNAAINYPSLNLLNTLNPFSAYYNNILEKEAFKENPWYTRIF